MNHTTVNGDMPAEAVFVNMVFIVPAAASILAGVMPVIAVLDSGKRIFSMFASVYMLKRDEMEKGMRSRDSVTAQSRRKVLLGSL